MFIRSIKKVSKKWVVINKFRSKLLRTKRNSNIGNPMGNDPVQESMFLYPEIRSRRACYEMTRLYLKMYCATRATCT